VGYQKSNKGEKGRHTFAGNSQEGDGAWPFDVRRRQVLNEFDIFGISSHADARNRSYVHANFRWSSIQDFYDGECTWQILHLVMVRMSRLVTLRGQTHRFQFCVSQNIRFRS